MADVKLVQEEDREVSQLKFPKEQPLMKQSLKLQDRLSLDSDSF